MRFLFCTFAFFAAALAPAFAQTPSRIEHLTSEDGAMFEAHIFEPAPSTAPGGAVVLLHGGGWVVGDASWVYPRAEAFARQGALAVAVDYRLANQRNLTPAQSSADARSVFRWLRANAATLNIDPTKIAAYGVSAGGQLSVSAAQSDDALARPNAIVLVSPALDLERDGWFARLMGGPEAARPLSPLSNMRAGLPPTLILQGDVDTETPLRGAQAFCDAMRGFGDRCVLKIYRGYGHLFTPAGINDRETPAPDPAISEAAGAFASAFLRREGYFR